MSDQLSYTGGCHCGAVRFSVTMALEKVISCNCSMCAKMGALLAFVPAEQFTLLSGEDRLQDYQFHKKVIHHVFCSVCGIHAFGRGVGRDGKPAYAINLRCVDDLDVSALKPIFFDGKSL
jgi:hypothetical protein